MNAGSQLTLCRLEDIPDGGCRGFDPLSQNEDTLFAVRRDAEVYVYRNCCPHNLRPLEYRRHQFLARNGDRIICYAHGAHFTIESGVCTYGPCAGLSLTAVPAQVKNGLVLVSIHHEPIFTMD